MNRFRNFINSIIYVKEEYSKCLGGSRKKQEVTKKSTHTNQLLLVGYAFIELIMKGELVSERMHQDHSCAIGCTRQINMSRLRQPAILASQFTLSSLFFHQSKHVWIPRARCAALYYHTVEEEEKEGKIGRVASVSTGWLPCAGERSKGNKR